MGIFGSISHAVRGAVRTGQRVAGTREDAGDQQRAQGAAQEAAQHQAWASATPEQRAEQARAAAYAAGPTYLEKWETVQPTSYSLGGDPNQANAYAAQAQATGQQHAQYLDQAAQQSQGVGYQFGQDLANSGNAAQQFGMNVGETAMGYGQQQGQMLGQAGREIVAQGQGAAARSVGQPTFDAMNQNINAANPNFGAQNQALDRATQAGMALQGLEAQEGPSAAQAQLRSGLNQAQASNIALARSGRGWGGGASAMSQAQAQNAAAGQNAANEAAALRAQENAAYRQRAAQNLGAAAGINLGAGQQFMGQQGQETQAALARAGLQMGQQQMASDAALRQQAQNDAMQQGMYGIGLNAQQAGAQLGLSGLTEGANIAQQGFGQQQAGLQAGGQMNLAGLGQSGQLSQAGGMLDLTAQQQALGAQQQQVANNMAYQNQMIDLHQGNQQMQMNTQNNNATAKENAKQRTVQYVGAGLNALGSAVGALSDRDKKKDIKPANRELVVPSPVEDIDSMAAGQALMDRGNPYTDDAMMARAQYKFGGGPMPFEQGVGISGPNQAQGASASEGAALAAGVQSPKSTGGTGSSLASAIGGGVGQLGSGLMQATPLVRPQGFAPLSSQPTAIPQPNMPTLSDKNAKRDYAMSDEDAKETVSKAPGYSYHYKDPDAMGAADGLQFGIMAQDLEKTPAGRSVVKKQPDGTRMVDTSRLAMVNTAALNALNAEVEQLRKLVGKGRKAA